MAVVVVSAGDHMGTGGICIYDFDHHIDSCGIRLRMGTGLFGAGNYFLWIKGIGGENVGR